MRRALLLLSLMAGVSACATVSPEPVAQVAAPAPAPAAAQAQATAPAVPAIRYTTRTLANGLRVYALRDEDSPNVAIQVWYGVGGRDDPRGRSGFAHLFEHLMFKSTRNMPTEMFDRLTEDVGGENNAFTSEDVTGYYEVVPANHLERLLWAEAERMGSLVVEPGFFASERDVVKEELRSRVFTQPYGRLLSEYYPAIAYNVDPYARMVAGSLADLDAATIEDVRAFHATYYRPDNAVMVVSGRFDEAALDRWIDRYFAPIARPAREMPRVTAREPERTQAVTRTVYEANTPLPAVLIAYPIPPIDHSDVPALEVLDGILSTGESSRFHQSLVYRQQLASQAASFADTRRGPGNLVAYAILSEGKSPEAGAAGLRAEIARLRDAPVTAAELEEAKNELLTTAIRERETVDGRAGAIAGAVMLQGDAGAADRRLAQIAAVTAEDVQRVARLYLRDERSAAIHYLPEEMRPNPQAGDRIALAPTVETRALETPPGVQVVSLAPEGQRVAPPMPGPAVVTAVPAPVTQRLANGLTVVTVENRGLPLVSANLVFNSGSAADNRAGRAALTAALVTEGTATRSATEIDQAAEALGASLDASSQYYGTTIGLTVRTENADAALGLVSDVARNATFSGEELERQRAQFLDSYTLTLGNPGALSRLVAARALYGMSPLGAPAGGTPESLRAITREDLVELYRSWSPSTTTLVLAGDIDPAGARALAERHFGAWPAAAAGPAAPQPQVAQPSRANEVIVIDMPGSGQAAVAVARNTIARGDPRFYRALVANAVLGGGYSARLNQEIRIRRGLAYGAGSNIDARRMPGPFIATTQTRNDAAPEVLGLILAEMRRLGAEPIPASEIDVRRTVLLGSFGRRAETTEGLADLVASYVVSGLAPEEIARYQQAVMGVGPADAQAAAAELLAPEGAVMVIVGDARLFVDRLRRERARVTVIPVGDLDLGSATLR